MTEPLRAVLFDLDGTLVDTAPDLAGAANEMRLARGLAALPFEHFRPMASSGVRGMVGVALNKTPQDGAYAELRDEYLARYETRLTRESRVFPEMLQVLAALEARSLRWGIVTNKIERYTAQVVLGLGLATRAAVVVSGDSTPHAKPHPAPLLEAARSLGLSPGSCIYVGDDLRDVQAGQAAGMLTVAAAWGYLGEGGPIEAWQADFVIARPNELLKLLPVA